MNLTTRMELNLRRLSESDPDPLDLWIWHARQLQGVGLAVILSQHFDGRHHRAQARITDAGRDWIDAN